VAREQKDYIGRRFEVEPTKLTKLLQVMHEKLAGPGDQSDSFVVYMVDNHSAQLQTLDEVLALDNSKKHRIVRLQIHSQRRINNNTSPQSEIDVDFGVTFKSGTSSQTGVTIEVAGQSRVWVADALSEIEQQVERSWVQHGPPIVSIVLIFFATLLAIFMSLLGPRFETGETARALATSMWLTGHDISPYTEKLSRSEALTEDEQRQIFSRQMANVNSLFEHYDQIERESFKSARGTLLAAVAIAAVGIILFIRGYPASVFLWGDEKSRQETRERVKRVLWPVLLAISLIPVVVQLFLPGLLNPFK
jgi:hypothetical protein